MPQRLVIITALSIASICVTGTSVSRIAAAQSMSSPLISGRIPTSASLGVYFEDFRSDEDDLSELSNNVYLEIPLGRSVVASLQAGHAVVSATGSGSFAGFDDTQLTISGARRLKNGSVLATLSGNIPSGKQELPFNEFEASVPLSYNFFDFRIPSLGQAPGVSAGVAAAYAPAERLAFGFGLSYTLHGGFKPIDGMQDAYQPGNELVVTSGIELELSPRTSASADFTYTLYGHDRLRDVTIFEAGPKAVVALQLTSHFDYNTLVIAARHRTHADSRILTSETFMRTETLTLPAQTKALLQYDMRVSKLLFASLFAAARYFESSTAFSEKVAIDFGVGPSIRLSRIMTLMSRFVYTVGDIDGYEAGLNLGVQI